ncbi:MAG: rhomboid family intramembrane serine protease [Rhodothermales bacterium]
MWYRLQPAALRALLTINVVLYVVWQLPLKFIPPVATFVLEHLALNPAVPQVFFEPWQFITYNFLHLGVGLGGFLHVLFNMLWLVWMGRDYEELHGKDGLMAVYLIGGIGGGLLSVAVNGIPLLGASVIYGASASVIAVMTALAIRHPYKQVALFFFPPIRIIYLVLIFLAFDLLFLGASNTAIAAHAGGALFGFLMATLEKQGRDLSSWTGFLFPDGRSRSSRSRSSSRSSHARPDPDAPMMERLETWLAGRKKPSDEDETEPTKRRGPRPVMSPTKAGQAEVDRILDKISQTGYESLTDEEKQTLYEASQR